MRLLIVNWRDLKHPLHGGAELHIQNIASRLAGNFGHQVMFLSNRNGGGLASSEEYDGIGFYRFGNEFNFNFLVMARLKGVVKKFEPDLIIEDVNKVPFFCPLYIKRPVMLVIPHLFSRTIFRQTNLILASYVYLAEKMMGPVYKNCHVHVISDSTKHDLVAKGYREDDISVAECGVDHSIYIPGGMKFEHPTICYTGRIMKYKSVDHLLYAASKVVAKVPDSKFIIIGDGEYLRELKALSRKLHLEDNVDFPGFIPLEDKIKLLQGSHCLVYPSIKEGWGISNIEANACGTPAIAADVPGLRDSVDDNVSGLLYKYGDIDELSNKIISVISDESLRLKLEKGAMEWASRFTWDNTAGKFNTILQNRYPRLFS